MKKVAIVQSSYIPWRGYFDLIASVDEFILLDDVQYTKRDWRNRNLIKTAKGLQWLTIPVETKGRFHQKISETIVKDPSWQREHWLSILHNYAKAPYFTSYRHEIEQLYLATLGDNLSQINEYFLTQLCELLEIDTPLARSSDYEVAKVDKCQRLIELCQKAGASYYLSGPKAAAYLDLMAFDKAGIEVAFIDYSQYQMYPQSYGVFEQGVSIIDMIFNLGPATKEYFKKQECQYYELQPRADYS